MADKYIRNNAGTLTETEAAETSTGAGDAGRIVGLDSTGRIDATMMPTGIAADVTSIVAGEALSAGDFVNVHDDAGAFKVRKADASTTGKEAHGFVLSAATVGNNVDVYWEGTNGQLSGLTPGVQFLSAVTPGAASATAPSASGQVVQRLGVATTATSLAFEATQPIVLA